MTILEQIFKTVEFDKYLKDGLNNQSLWKTSKIERDNCFAIYDDEYYLEDYAKELSTWGGWMSDDFFDNIDNPDLVYENHYRIGSDVEEIDSVSLNGRLLIWALHQD